MSALCKKCDSSVSQNYCPNCGNPITLRRIDKGYLLQEVSAVLSFDKGFFYTIVQLATKPGKNVVDFLNEDRNRLVKPIVFLVVTSLIYTILNNIFRFEDSYVQFVDTKESATSLIFKWIQGNYGYANIIMALFISGWIKLFFRRREFNIFEILVMLCFTMGMGMLIYSIFGVVEILINIKLMQIASIVGFVYLTWAIGQFYGKGKFFNYLKAFFAYILGMLTFSLAAVLTGTIIDLFV